MCMCVCVTSVVCNLTGKTSSIQVTSPVATEMISTDNNPSYAQMRYDTVDTTTAPVYETMQSPHAVIAKIIITDLCAKYYSVQCFPCQLLFFILYYYCSSCSL